MSHRHQGWLRFRKAVILVLGHIWKNMLMLQRQSSRRKTEWLAYNNTTASTVTYIRCLHLHTTDAKNRFQEQQICSLRQSQRFCLFHRPCSPRRLLHCIVFCCCYAMRSSHHSLCSLSGGLVSTRKCVCR